MRWLAAQPWHLKIVANLGGMLYVRFRGRECEQYSSDVRVRVKASELYTYPDLAASCGAPEFETASNPHSLLNPQVIFEVLSPSTEAFDRGDKFFRYQQLESLIDYVLLSSEQMRVEHFVRQADGSWQYKEYHRPEDRLPLASVGCELPLAEVYERVVFPDSVSR